MIKLILWLTLTVGSLFSQEPQMGCFMPQELQKALAPTPDQCQRIQLAHQAFWQESEPLFEKMQTVQSRLDHIFWGEITMSDDQLGEEVKKATLEHRKLFGLLREIENKRSRAVLNVLDQRQRQLIDGLTKMAPAFLIFRDAVDVGLIPAEVAYPRGSGMKGLAERRRVSGAQ